MSIHPSLSSGDALMRHRNVLTRIERLTKLENEGRWQEGDSLVGLPKVRNIKVVIKKKKAKTAEEEEEGATTDEAATGDSAAGASS